MYNSISGIVSLIIVVGYLERHLKSRRGKTDCWAWPEMKCAAYVITTYNMFSTWSGISTGSFQKV